MQNCLLGTLLQFGRATNCLIKVNRSSFNCHLAILMKNQVTDGENTRPSIRYPITHIRSLSNPILKILKKADCALKPVSNTEGILGLTVVSCLSAPFLNQIATSHLPVGQQWTLENCNSECRGLECIIKVTILRA